MGKTAFSGPVYGAKALLWTVGPLTASSGATTSLIAARTIPPFEDWYLTDYHITTSTCSSVGNSVILKTEGGSTLGVTRFSGGLASTMAQTVFNVNTGTSTVMSTNGVITATPGEFEGLYVPAGSSMRVVSSGVNGIAGLAIQIMGYIRFVSSTRAES